MKFALTATAVDNSMDASEKSSVLDMLGDFVDAKLNDLSGLASSAVDFAVNNKSFMLHTTLDVVGLLPGIGNFADGLNAVVYLLEGDMGNVACSLMACIPLAGVAAVGVKYTGKAADATITFFKNSDKLSGFVDKSKDFFKGGDGLFSKLFKKADDVPVNNTKAEVLAKNRANGRAFEEQEFSKFANQFSDAQQQITIKTESGVKTRVDAIGLDSDGNVVIHEFKSSLTATLTSNQNIAFPEIFESGGTVVGKGKGRFSGGYKIPAGTTVKIIRPNI